MISFLAPLPIPLVLMGNGSRCAGYLSGRQHPGGRRKWKAVEAGWGEKCV